MPNTRCEEVVVQMIVRTYDDENRPLSEERTNTIKVFRNAATQDFWTWVDAVVAQAVKAPPRA